MNRDDSCQSSGCGWQQAPGDLGTAHAGDGVRVADDDEAVGRAGQADVEPFGGSVARPVLVDAQHQGAAFHALEAEHVPVEDVVGVPEKVPVALLPQGRLTLGLLRGRAPRVISAMSPACQPSSKGASTCSSAASKASEVVEATSVASGPSPPRNSMQVGASGTNVCNVPSKTTQSVTRPGFRE